METFMIYLWFLGPIYLWMCKQSAYFNLNYAKLLGEAPFFVHFPPSFWWWSRKQCEWGMRWEKRVTVPRAHLRGIQPNHRAIPTPQIFKISPDEGMCEPPHMTRNNYACTSFVSRQCCEQWSCKPSTPSNQSLWKCIKFVKSETTPP